MYFLSSVFAGVLLLVATAATATVRGYRWSTHTNTQTHSQAHSTTKVDRQRVNATNGWKFVGNTFAFHMCALFVYVLREKIVCHVLRTYVIYTIVRMPGNDCNINYSAVKNSLMANESTCKKTTTTEEQSKAALSITQNRNAIENSDIQTTKEERKKWLKDRRTISYFILFMRFVFAFVWYALHDVKCILFEIACITNRHIF